MCTPPARGPLNSSSAATGAASSPQHGSPNTASPWRQHAPATSWAAAIGRRTDSCPTRCERSPPGTACAVRNPHAVRPWQHVLEPLSGYLLLGARLMAVEAASRSSFCTAWNFGPGPENAQPVARVVAALIDAWGSGGWDDVHDPTSVARGRGITPLDREGPLRTWLGSALGVLGNHRPHRGLVPHPPGRSARRRPAGGDPEADSGVLSDCAPAADARVASAKRVQAGAMSGSVLSPPHEHVLHFAVEHALPATVRQQ